MSSKKQRLFGLFVLVGLVVLLMYFLLYESNTILTSIYPSVTMSSPVFGRQNEYFQRHYQDVENTVFIFSVIAMSREFKAESWDQVAINAWERRGHGRTFSCVYEYIDVNGRTIVMRKNATDKHHLFWGNEADLISVQIMCDLAPLKVRDYLRKLSGIGLSFAGSSDGNITFQQPVYVDYQNASKRFAISGKIIYGRKDAKQLVEWIEFHKHFGADHILLYAYHDLNRKTLEVLDYYETSRYIEVVYMPAVAKIDEFPRHFSVRPHPIIYHDEHVADFDTQTRLSGYTYFVLFDTDEFVSPVHHPIKTYTQLMEHLLKEKRNAASFKLLTEIYMTTWGETHPTDDMFITRYRNRTPAFDDRKKNLQVTSRIKPGSAWIHTVEPRNGFTWEVAKDSVVVLKHYRSCRDEWLIPNPENNNQTQCDTFKRVHDEYMLDVAARIRDKVLKTTKHLGIP